MFWIEKQGIHLHFGKRNDSDVLVVNTTDQGTHFNQFIIRVFFAGLYIQGIQRYVREYQSWC